MSGAHLALPAAPRRTVHCADALEWLAAQGELEGCSIVTSLPDVSELPSLSLAAWKEWFVRAAESVLESCWREGVAIFYQTDIKREGTWVDKGYLCFQAAERAGFELLWHKAVCRRPPGATTYGRAGYSHMLCFSRTVRVDLARSTPDVLPTAGPSPWTRGMGLEACLAACRFIRDETRSHTVVDPFCGRGTALAAANALGLDAIGVELSAKRCRQARALTVDQLR